MLPDSELPARRNSAEALAVANRLRPVLLHLSRHLRREIHETRASAGQISILAAAFRQPGIGINELAALEGISPPSMSNAVDKLEASGLIVRTRETAGDRRRVGLAVTGEGSRVLKSVRSRRTAWLAERLARLTPEQMTVLDAAIGPLAALVEREGASSSSRGSR
jgi:DNA-binding MarR family transcriptional regulator